MSRDRVVIAASPRPENSSAEWLASLRFISADEHPDHGLANGNVAAVCRSGFVCMDALMSRRTGCPRATSREFQVDRDPLIQ